MEQKQYELAAQVLREVQKVILGKREIVEKVLDAVLAQGHVLLDDVPGVGKIDAGHGLRARARAGDPPRAVHAGHDAVGHSGLLRL